MRKYKVVIYFKSGNKLKVKCSKAIVSNLTDAVDKSIYLHNTNKITTLDLAQVEAVTIKLCLFKYFFRNFTANLKEEE